MAVLFFYLNDWLRWKRFLVENEKFSLWGVKQANVSFSIVGFLEYSRLVPLHLVFSVFHVHPSGANIVKLHNDFIPFYIADNVHDRCAHSRPWSWGLSVTIALSPSPRLAMIVSVRLNPEGPFTRPMPICRTDYFPKTPPATPQSAMVKIQ